MIGGNRVEWDCIMFFYVIFYFDCIYGFNLVVRLNVDIFRKFWNEDFVYILDGNFLDV